LLAYRAAHDPITRPPIKSDPREIYHSLWPAPALSPVPRPDDPESVALQADNETAYRQLLVDSFLAVLLPTEDLENNALTALVGQILSELIIRNTLINKLSEPWFIWELLIIVSRAAGGQRGTAAGTPEAEDHPGSSSSHTPRPGGGRRAFSLRSLFWAIVHWAVLAISFIRAAFSTLMMSRSLPPRTLSYSSGFGGVKRYESDKKPSPESVRHAEKHPSKKPIVAFRLWSAVSNLVEVDLRMPWLSGTLSMLQWIAIAGPGRIAGLDGALDR
jgi:hypothetical protein